MTVTSNVVEALRRNEFALNYDIDSVVTIEVDNENIDIFTVMSHNRRHYLESIANKMSIKKGAKNDRASVYSAATTTTQGTAPQFQGNTDLLKIQPILKGKMPHWINRAVDAGGPVSVNNMISWAPIHEGDSRTVTSMSFAVSDGRTSTILGSDHGTRKSSSGVTEIQEPAEITVENEDEAERQMSEVHIENGTNIRSILSRLCSSFPKII